MGETLTTGPLTLKKVLHLHEVDGSNRDGPIVRYDSHDELFLATRRGVYLVAQNDVAVYCGKFTNTFAKRWLYTRGRYVYHFKRSIISDALLQGHKIVVYAQEEEILREQIGQPGNAWISITSIEEKLIQDLRPCWNMVGLVKQRGNLNAENLPLLAVDPTAHVRHAFPS